MTKARIVAGIAALTSAAILLFAPALVYRTVAGIPLDASGPDWEIWLIVIGGGLGAGLGRLVHHRVMVRLFASSNEQEEAAWRG